MGLPILPQLLNYHPANFSTEASGMPEVPESPKNVLLFCGTDGHGVTSCAVSLRNLRDEGHNVQVVSKFPDTQFAKLFWEKTAPNTPLPPKPCMVVVVDIPVDAGNPHSAAEMVRRWRNEGCEVWIVDHHKSSEMAFSLLAEAGARLRISPNAAFTYYGDRSDDWTRKWMRIGAITDRDKAVLPVTEEEMLLADGLDESVRRPDGPVLTIREILDDREDEIRARGERFRERIRDALSKVKVERVGPDAAIIEGPVPPGLRFKMMDRVAQDLGVCYAAVKTTLLDREYNREMDHVTVITNWRKECISARAKLLDVEREIPPVEVRGHDEAPTYVFEKGDGDRFIARVREDLSRQPMRG